MLSIELYQRTTAAGQRVRASQFRLNAPSDEALSAVLLNVLSMRRSSRTPSAEPHHRQAFGRIRSVRRGVSGTRRPQPAHRPDHHAYDIGRRKSATLARDTVFAAAMITMTGIVGLSLLIGSLRYGIIPIQRRRQRRLAGHRHHARHAQPRLADVYHQPRGTGVHAQPVDVRRIRVARALRGVPVHPDGAAPQLLPCQSRRRAWSTTRPSTRRRQAPAPR